MGWSITVGSVAGTKVRIHITFLLLLAWIFFANYFSTGPQAHGTRFCSWCCCSYACCCTNLDIKLEAWSGLTKPDARYLRIKQKAIDAIPAILETLACGAPSASTRQPSSCRLAIRAPMHAILWRGCFGNPEPSTSRTSASGALPKSSIRAAASRSGTVSRSHTTADCSGITSLVQ
jgi:hypothetical protein